MVRNDKDHEVLPDDTLVKETTKAKETETAEVKELNRVPKKVKTASGTAKVW